jgi:hypothetical protein
MGTTYEYTYEYEVTDTNKHNRTGGNYAHRSTGHPSQYGVRTNPVDPLANLQHDRIWHKLYDPLDMDKAIHETEIQVSECKNDLVENHLILLRMINHDNEQKHVNTFLCL